MRVNRFALAIIVCAGLAVVAGRAQAGVLGGPSDLFDSAWFHNDANDPNSNFCELVNSGTTALVFGAVQGLGTGGEVVRVQYTTPTPTSSSRKTQSAKVSQSTWSQITFNFGATQVGPAIVDKCSVSGSLNVKKSPAQLNVSVDCKGSDVFSLLTANQVASLQTAFTGRKDVKVKVNADKNKASISIKCKGDALED